MEVQTSLDAIGCVYNNFVVNDCYVSIVGFMHAVRIDLTNASNRQ